VRRAALALPVQPVGGVGQVHAVQANLRYPASVQTAVHGSDIVINLVGILFERGKQRFSAVQAEGPGLVAQAAGAAGARMIHVSAIGADPGSPALYPRTKAAREQALLAACPTATIFLPPILFRTATFFRPLICFGPEDEFFNRFAAIARLSPALPLIGGGQTKFQPVFVGDVAAAITKAADGEARQGVTYELGGPDVRTFKELLE